MSWESTTQHWQALPGCLVSPAPCLVLLGPAEVNPCPCPQALSHTGSPTPGPWAAACRIHRGIRLGALSTSKTPERAVLLLSGPQCPGSPIGAPRPQWDCVETHVCLRALPGLFMSPFKGNLP